MERTVRSAPICGSMDTGLLKIIAVLTMLIDHIGAALFPGEALWRLVGRLSWPLFAYCLVVGFLCTHDLKRYALRIAAFALVSQPFYLLAFYPWSLELSFWQGATFSALWNGFRLNIFFTMLLGLLGLYGLREKKYIFTLAALLLSLAPAVSYSYMGVLLIILIWLLREVKPPAFALALAAFLSLYFFRTPAGFRLFGDVYVDIQGFSVLAVPLICARTQTGWRLPKYFYYVFYPAHLLALALLKSIV